MPASLRIVLLLGLLSLTSADQLASEYDHFVALDPAQKMKLYWTVNRTEKTISFAVEATTTGWVGFGFSTGTGRMKGADIVIGWVKEGKAHLTDRHGEGNFLPTMDDGKSSYKLIGGTEVNGKTTLKFSRNIDTCDPQDRKIEDGTMKVIFAYHNHDPASANDMKKHVYKGARSIQLLSYVKNVSPDPSWQKLDLLMNNITLPAYETAYTCKAFKMPNFGGKRHIVRFDAVIKPGNEGFVHHLIVYECHSSFPDHLTNYTNYCLANMPPDMNKCRKGDLVMGWGIGDGPVLYPDHAGYPIGMDNDSRFYVMEIHYDNPERISGKIDNSGVRIYYTSKLRQYDAGILSVGEAISWRMVIPPKQDKWITTSYCFGKCTEKFLKNTTIAGSGVKIFASFLHTHLAGRAIWTKHVRNGVELPEISRDNSYDFNFQEIRILPKEIHYRPGDDLITQCVYNTNNRTATTYGGARTQDEMCLNFLFYYPRILNLPWCISTNRLGFEEFSAKNYSRGTGNQTTYIENPLVNPSTQWTKEMVHDLKNAYEKQGRYRAENCGSPPADDYITKVNITKPLNPTTSECTKDRSTVPTSTNKPSTNKPSTNKLSTNKPFQNANSAQAPYDGLAFYACSVLLLLRIFI